MGKIIKTKTNKWRARVYLGRDKSGKQIVKTITCDTKAECQRAVADAMESKQRALPKLTVRECVEKYIELSKEVLSPTTLHLYERLSQNGFNELMPLEVATLTDTIMQEHINNECKRASKKGQGNISAKTIKNEWGLISASLKACAKMTFNVRLPKIQVSPEELPEPNAVIKMIKGSPIELPGLLAMQMSLRMSEVRGLKCSAVRNGYLYIEQVKVMVGNIDTIKVAAKTDASRRRLKIPDEIMSLIENTEAWKRYLDTGEDGYIVDMKANAIAYQFRKLCKEHKIDMTFHDLRHEYASIMLNILNVVMLSMYVIGNLPLKSLPLKSLRLRLRLRLPLL